MDIPESFQLRERMHGHGSRGYFFYCYVDTSNLGIRREVRGSGATRTTEETWTLDALPDQVFPTLAALREAARPLTEADIAVTMAAYPKITEIKPDTCGNFCCFCPKVGLVNSKSTQVRIARTWADLDYAFLCEPHLAQYRDDPRGLCAALDAARAERKARRDQMLRPPWR